VSWRLAIRILLATLLSPLAAAFCVAILLSGWLTVEDLSRGVERNSSALDFFFQGIALFTMLGIVVAGLFTIAFALLTQLPLIWANRRFGRPYMLLHLLISAAMGPPLFLGYFALLASEGPERVEPSHPLARSPAPPQNRDLAMVLAIGATGGAAVGLVWHLLVLGGVSRGPGSAPGGST
jgi:hypothetical protein